HWRYDPFTGDDDDFDYLYIAGPGPTLCRNDHCPQPLDDDGRMVQVDWLPTDEFEAYWKAVAIPQVMWKLLNNRVCDFSEEEACTMSNVEKIESYSFCLTGDEVADIARQDFTHAMKTLADPYTTDEFLTRWLDKIQTYHFFYFCYAGRANVLEVFAQHGVD
ncbi:hypothetical protein ACFL6C_13150, partial [Myxococcota bacterium]